MAKINALVNTDPPPGVGKQTFSNVVAAATMAYQLHNRDPKNRKADGTKTLPSVQDVARYANHSANQVQKVLASNEFLLAMRERGVYWDARDALAPEQVYALGILTNPADKRDMAGKLKAAGISYQTYRMWLRQPLFARAIRQVGEDMLGDHIADVNTAVVRSAVDGNMKAVEIFNQMTGRFDPNQQQVADLQRMVNLLLETIFRYVTDVGTLRKINEDFEKIMSGKTPEASLGEIEDAIIVEETDEHPGHSPAGNSGLLDRSAGSVPVDAAPVDDNDDIPPGFFDYQEEIKDFTL